MRMLMWRLKTLMNRLGSGPGLVGRLGSGPRLVGRLGSGPGLVCRLGSGPGLVGRLGSGPHLVGRLGSGPQLVGWLGSGVRVSASFQICLVASCYTLTSTSTSACYTLKHRHIRIMPPAHPHYTPSVLHRLCWPSVNG